MISPAEDLRQHMAQVLDPRGHEGKRHPLSAILTAVVCAVICGANGYKPICQWLHQQPVDFWHFLGFTRRPIQYGALRNLLMVLARRRLKTRCGPGCRRRLCPLPPAKRGPLSPSTASRFAAPAGSTSGR